MIFVEVRSLRLTRQLATLGLKLVVSAWPSRLAKTLLALLHSLY